VFEEDLDFLSDLLSMLEDTSCDFNHFFYRLGNTAVFTLATSDEYARAAELILPSDPENVKHDSIRKLATWLETKYRPRLEKEGSTNDSERRDRMNAVNPKFLLRQWVLEEVIKNTKSERNTGVENKDMLDKVLTMALDPFRDFWGGDKNEEARLCGDVPKVERGFQCSCSS
jgi:serine/tyrosine/threonine adenylyltransferase